MQWVWLVVAILVLLVEAGVRSSLDQTSRADPAGRADPIGRAFRRWLPTMGLASLIGIWAAVPDTEPPLVAVGVLLPIAVVTLLGNGSSGDTGSAVRAGHVQVEQARAGQDRAGQARAGQARAERVSELALIVLIVGAAWVGSAGWWSARASVAAVGMVLWIPVIRAANGRTSHRVARDRTTHDRTARTRLGAGLHRRGRATLVGLHAVHALVLPRAVMRMDSGVAWGIVGVTTVILVAATAYLLYLPPRTDP